MDKGTRIRLIQQVRDALNNMGWEDVDLLLDEFEIGALPESQDDISLTHRLRQAMDDDLVALGRHLAVPVAADAAEGVADTTATTATGGEPGRLFVFGSHLSTQRALVGEVEVALRHYGITLFVAHDSIPIDADWQPEIADALRRCDAGVAFVHKGLHDSYYCMQEVGWLLGRGVPIARLLFDDAPKGLLGDKQGINARNMPVDEIAATILDYVAGKPELQPQLATSLVHAMKDSAHFWVTDAVWVKLQALADLTLGQATVLVEAAEEQSQVFRASAGGWGGANYRGVIADFLDGQAAAAPLAARIAQLQKFKDSGVAMHVHTAPD